MTRADAMAICYATWCGLSLAAIRAAAQAIVEMWAIVEARRCAK